jgi:hypothetical protein
MSSGFYSRFGIAGSVLSPIRRHNIYRTYYTRYGLLYLLLTTCIVVAGLFELGCIDTEVKLLS